MRRAVIAIVLIFAGSSVLAQADAGLTAAQAWIGRALVLRGGYVGNELDFDATGHVKGVPGTKDWTLAGMDVVSVARRATGELELDGVRVVIGYNQGGHVFERHPQKEQKLRVLVASLPDPMSVDAALAAVFSQGEDPAFERAQPSYWSHLFLPALPWTGEDELKGVTVLGANGKVPADLVQPVLEKKVDVEATPEARTARIKGSVQAALVVDTAGVPRRIVLRQPLGFGLDASVVAALRRYRFRPGTLNGQPVAVEVIVNEAFDLSAAGTLR